MVSAAIRHVIAAEQRCCGTRPLLRLDEADSADVYGGYVLALGKHVKGHGFTGFIR